MNTLSQFPTPAIQKRMMIVYLRVAKNCQQNKLLYLAQHMHHQPQDKYVELPAGIVESTEASKKQVDLDEEIRRLEAELAACC